ncbi:hypothetical protein Plhal304r1_c029g0096061 [Plasmopara halstedii]
MFLELSFVSPIEDKRASKVSKSWGNNHDDRKELSLDELISDFHKGATNESKQDYDASSSSDLKYSKPKQRLNNSRARIADSVKYKSNQRTVKNTQQYDLSDDDSIVPSMPRIENALRNKPSLMGRRRRATARQRQTFQEKSLVLPSRSLTPPSLSLVLSKSTTLSESEKSPKPISTDSVDSLIRNEISDLNNLVSTSNQIRAQDNDKLDKSTRLNRQASRFGSLKYLQMPEMRSRVEALESPPQSQPPEESGDETEDSFAAEIRQLRASWRSKMIPNKEPDKGREIDEDYLKTSDVCVTTALKVRNASNTIHELLHEALQPFENRFQEECMESKDEDVNVDNNSDSMEMQSTTQTIVSQLDVAFAEMVKRQNADLMAEQTAAVAAKEAEAKEKEAAEEKKKKEEKEARAREMEILESVPMHGKLLTCSADIDRVLEQLESVDISFQNEGALNAEMRALRIYTHQKIQEIEAQMSVGDVKDGDALPQRAKWVSETESKMMKEDPKNLTAFAARDESAGRDDTYQEILQRQVIENLNLSILRLRHVLEIDAKEAAESKESQKREHEEQENKKLQQQIEDEAKKRDLRDAEVARQRVLGLSSIDEVDDWVNEGRRLESVFNHDKPLNRLLASMEKRLGMENEGEDAIFSSFLTSNCDNISNRSSTVLKSQKLRENADFECTSFKLQKVAPFQRPFRLEDTNSDVIGNMMGDDGERDLTRVKKSRRKDGDPQYKVNRLIQALQAERRQKTVWIQNRLCTPKSAARSDYTLKF